MEVFLRLFTLLYAYDTVVLAENEKDLQLTLNGIKSYCDSLNLTVNIDKTKAVVFSTGKIRKKPVFHFGDIVLEVTDGYSYLGVNFNFSNKFTKAKALQVNQAQRALYGLLAKSS